MSSKDVAVVVQTHWDREWYYPHQTFLARLLGVMETVVSLLDSGDLQSFLFDGQVSAIEDFFQQGEPALVARVQEHVATGRIVIGPWYIMSDEFLCAGESLVRNLALGIKRARQHGNCQRVGYLPDTFGHVSQMPQLLQGFGIDNAVAWRGVDASQSEVCWQGPDGSELFMVFLSEGYYQHPFNVEHWQTALNQYLSKVADRSGASTLLLTQGGDHLQPVAGLSDKIACFNASQSAFTLRQTGLEEYVRDLQKASDLRDLAVVSGELRGNRQAFVLPDVLSTRQYLKQQNQLLEDRLTGLIEPLLAQAWLAQPRLAADTDATMTYPHRYLEQTWQLLIEQHAHDSICGCSIDEVHREMMTRFAQLEQRLSALQGMAQRALAMTGDRLSATRQGAPDPFADDRRFSLFNPSLKPRSGWLEFELFLKGEQPAPVTLYTDAGTALPVRILRCEPAHEFHSPVDDFPDRFAGHRYTLAVHINPAQPLGGFTALPCRLQTREAMDAPIVDLAVRSLPAHADKTGAVSIANVHYLISVTEGQLHITDKATGKTYRDALQLISEPDGGDTYNFSPASGQHFTAVFGTAVACATQDAEPVQVLNIPVQLTQPAGLNSARQIDPARVISTGNLSLRLMPACDLIEARLDWHNAARDHRLRLQLALGESVSWSESDTAFDWVRRPKHYADFAQVKGQQESTVAVFPSQTAARAGRVGFIHRGLQEMALVPDRDQDRLAVTLLRSVGWLSRRDLVTRGLGAGPDLPTPEAQCLREHSFAFAFCFSAPAGEKLLTMADAWRRPVTALRGHRPGAWPGLQLANPALQISSIRHIDSEIAGAALEVRVWNPTDVPQSASFSTEPVARTRLCGAVELSSDSVLTPRQIATFVFSRRDLLSDASKRQCEESADE